MNEEHIPQEGCTLSECFDTLAAATVEDSVGIRPSIVPENAVKINGFWQWEDRNMVFSWAPGMSFVNCWSKEIYVSSRIKNNVV